MISPLFPLSSVAYSQQSTLPNGRGSMYTRLPRSRLLGNHRRGRSLQIRDTDPIEPQALMVVTSKTPWPPAWPCRPRSLRPSSYRWSCCSTYRWNPSRRFLRTSRGTSYPLLQSYPLCDRTTFLPLLWFATGVFTRSGQSPIRWRDRCPNNDQDLGPAPFAKLPRRGLLGNSLPRPMPSTPDGYYL